jgi:hypothetical protein
MYLTTHLHRLTRYTNTRTELTLRILCPKNMKIKASQVSGTAYHLCEKYMQTKNTPFCACFIRTCDVLNTLLKKCTVRRTVGVHYTYSSTSEIKLCFSL